MLETKLTVASFDVYPNSTIKPAAIQRYMQQYAREDCDQMGCTYVDMRKVNMVFVITKLAISVKKPVFAYDELFVRTYNNRVFGASFEREFEFYRDGEEVIHATTQWVIVKYDDRSIVRPKLFPFEIPAHNLDCGSLELPRAISSDEEQKECGLRTVRLSDLDENDHLNNCIYSDISMDNIAEYDRKLNYVKDIKILFRHEAKLNDVLSIASGFNRSAENGVNYTVSAFNTTSGQPCFDTEVSFGSISG